MDKQTKTSHLDDRNLKPLIGGAIFVETARATGVWENNKLEEIIFNTGLGEYTGRFTQMRKGKIPKYTLNIILKKIKHHDIHHWLYHLLWRLLRSDEEIDHKDINKAVLDRCDRFDIHNIIKNHNDLNKLERSMLELKQRDEFYNDSVLEDILSKKTNIGRVRHEITPQRIERISETININSLTKLTALAKEAKISGKNETYNLCQYYSGKIFAEVISNSPNLYINWPILAGLYCRFIWCSHDNQTAYLYHSTLDELKNEINEKAVIARDKGVYLPPDKLVPNQDKVLNYLVALDYDISQRI